MLTEVTHLLLLQALPYVCLLIAMLFFIYAIIGMQVSIPPPACAAWPRAQQPALCLPVAASRSHPARQGP